MLGGGGPGGDGRSIRRKKKGLRERAEINALASEEPNIVM